MVYDLNNPPADGVSVTMVDPQDMTRQKNFVPDAPRQELLEPLLAGGQPVDELPNIEAIRARTLTGLDALDKSHTRLLRPHRYPVGLEKNLFDEQIRLIKKMKGISNGK